jgi:iron complex outermembrane receptor protein
MSVGGERREEEGYSIPDDNKRSGDLIGYVGSDPLRGERDVNAAFGELYVPIFSEDNRIPGIYALNVRGAARYEHYSDFGDVIKPGVRVGYNPIDEHFTIHASFSQSFVAPTWAELYTTAQEDFPDVRDPYSGVFQQIQTTELGNPDLEPQESDNFLIGAEWRVKQIPGLKLAIDYFRIERENIPGGSTQYILDENAASGGPANAVPNPAFDPTRPVTDANRPLIPGVNPSPGLYSDLIQYDPVAGQYIRVTVPTLNLTSDKLDGFDLYASYELDLGRVGLEGYGTLLFEMNWQYLLTYEQVQVPGTPAVDRLGDFSSDEFGYSSLPRWRGYGSVFYMYRDFSIGFFANYTDNYRDDSLVADRMVDDYLTFDIQASYLFPYQIRLTAGCLNVMDEPPPVVVASFADNYDRDLHDLRQRFWYVSLSKRF